MGVISKIVLVAINLACLLVSLARPSDATALSIIPVVVTSCTWMANTLGKDGLTENKERKIAYISIPAICAIVCFFLGLTSRVIEDDQSFGLYAIEFYEGIAFCSDVRFPYGVFAVFIMVTIVVFSVFEVLVALRDKERASAGEGVSADEIYSRDLRG